jgi:hypothetical protein
MGYVASTNNRSYVAIEDVYGQGAILQTTNRLPSTSRLEIRQAFERAQRADKTGSRTAVLQQSQALARTAFKISAPMTSWSDVQDSSWCSVLQAAFGEKSEAWNALMIRGATSEGLITTDVPHDLTTGDAVVLANEIRFVSSVESPMSLFLNLPFSRTPSVGASLMPATTFRLSSTLPSLTLADYWTAQGLSRIASGAIVDTISLLFTRQVCTFVASGIANEVKASGNTTDFPAEPMIEQANVSRIPTQNGLARIGATGIPLAGVTSIELKLSNHLKRGPHDFSSPALQRVSPGFRSCELGFIALPQTDGALEELYIAAQNGQTMPVTFQIGTQLGQMISVYMPRLMPAVPVFDDSEARLCMRFANCVPGGTNNDEVFVALA